MGKVVRLVGEAFCAGFARLADVAPPDRLIVLAEDTDWTLVGGDFQTAIDAVAVDEPAVKG